MDSVDDMNDMARRNEIAFQTFANTMTLIHSQIASINQRLDEQQARSKDAPVIVSHRGFGALPQAPPSPADSAPAPGDPVARYDQARGDSAAGLMKAMRESRNCGIASNVYSEFVDEIEQD